jgi:translation initiation factor IF-2
VIIKGDVQGSIEALADALNKLSTTDIKVKIIHSSTGAITETDVMLASSANAVIIGFNVRPMAGCRRLPNKRASKSNYMTSFTMSSPISGGNGRSSRTGLQGSGPGARRVRQLFKVPR